MWVQGAWTGWWVGEGARHGAQHAQSLQARRGYTFMQTPRGCCNVSNARAHSRQGKYAAGAYGTLTQPQGTCATHIHTHALAPTKTPPHARS